jgi:hypothetical protein
MRHAKSTYQNPRLKIPLTVIFFFVDICRFQTSGIGRRTIERSRNMLTETEANSFLVVGLQCVCSNSGVHVAENGLHCDMKKGMKARAYDVVRPMKM